MKNLFRLLFLMAAVGCAAADRLTITITVTNMPSQGDTLVVNGDTRTWTTNQSGLSTSQIRIATNGVASASATNLYSNIVGMGFSGPINSAQTAGTVVKLYGQQGQAIAASKTGSWGTLVTSTNVETTLTVLRIPFSAEPAALARTNAANGVIDGINSYGTSTINTAHLTDSGNFILRDGSVAFTGDQPMGTHKITGLGTPSSGTDAATKAYVDTLAGGAVTNVATSGGGGYSWIKSFTSGVLTLRDLIAGTGVTISTNANSITIASTAVGSAGGDLSGTYPNPTVAKINGVTLGTTTATSGRMLVADGSQWVSVPMSGDATLASNGALTLATPALAASSTNAAGHFDKRYDVFRVPLQNNLAGGTYTSSNLNAGTIRFWHIKADSGSRGLAVPARYTYIKRLVLSADLANTTVVGTNLFMAVKFGNPNTSQGESTGVAHLNDLSGAPLGGGDCAYNTNINLAAVQVGTNYAGTTLFTFFTTNAVAIPADVESDAAGMRRIMFFSLTMPLSAAPDSLTNNNNYGNIGFVEFGTTPDQLP